MFQRIGVVVLVATTLANSAAADDGAWSRVRTANDAAWRPGAAAENPFRTVQIKALFDTAAPPRKSRSSGALDANDGAPNWPTKPTSPSNPWQNIKPSAPSNPWQNVKPSGPRVPLFKFDIPTINPPVNPWRFSPSPGTTRKPAPNVRVIRPGKSAPVVVAPAPQRPAPLKANVAPTPTTPVRRNALPTKGLSLTGEENGSGRLSLTDEEGADPFNYSDQFVKEGEDAKPVEDQTTPEDLAAVEEASADAMAEEEMEEEEEEEEEAAPARPQPAEPVSNFPSEPTFPSSGDTPPSDGSGGSEPPASPPMPPPPSTPPGPTLGNEASGGETLGQESMQDGTPLGNEATADGQPLGQVAGDDGPADGTPLGKPATDDSVFVPPKPGATDNPWANLSSKPGANGGKPGATDSTWPQKPGAPPKPGASNGWSNVGGKKPSPHDFSPNNAGSKGYPQVKTGSGNVGSFPASAPVGKPSRPGAVVGGSIPVGDGAKPPLANAPPTNSKPSKGVMETLDSVEQRLAEDVEAEKAKRTEPRGVPRDPPYKYEPLDRNNPNDKWIKVGDPTWGMPVNTQGRPIEGEVTKPGGSRSEITSENHLPSDDPTSGRPNMGPGGPTLNPYDPRRQGQKVGDVGLGPVAPIGPGVVDPETGRTENDSVIGVSVKVDTSGAIRDDSRKTTLEEHYDRVKTKVAPAAESIKETAGEAIDGAAELKEDARKSINRATSAAENSLRDALRSTREALGGKKEPPPASPPTKDKKSGGR